MIPLIAPDKKYFIAWLETRMDKRSTEGWAGEWRKQALSGQPLCRTPIGAASSGVGAGAARRHKEMQRTRSYVLMCRSVHERYEKEKTPFGAKELFCGGGLRGLRASAL